MHQLVAQQVLQALERAAVPAGQTQLVLLHQPQQGNTACSSSSLHDRKQQQTAAVPAQSCTSS